MSKNFTFIFFLFFAFQVNAQFTEEELDDIEEFKAIVASDAHDSTRIKAMLDWDSYIYKSDPTQDSILCFQILQTSNENLQKELNEEEKLFFTKTKATGHNYVALVYEFYGQPDSAIVHYHQSIEAHKSVGNENGLDASYINLGNAYAGLGDMANAMDAYNKGLEMTDKTGNIDFKSNAIQNIGLCYLNLGDYKKAEEYMRKSLRINIEYDLIRGLPGNYINLGTLFEDGDLDSALYYYRLGIQPCLDVNEFSALGTIYHNMGETFIHSGNLDSAEYYLELGAELREVYDPEHGMIYSYSGFCELYRKLGKTKESIENGEKAFNLAKKINYVEAMQIATNQLSLTYEAAGMFKEALENYRLYVELTNEIKSEENQKEIISRELEYNYQKEKLADSLAFQQEKELDQLQHEKELQAEAQQRYILYGGLFAVLILGVIAFMAFRRKKKDNEIISQQKQEVEHQKEMVEEAHKEITDSIAYAKRIQSAILPPDSEFHATLKDAFVLYMPKDVVAGDFYWMHSNDDEVIFAAADCTGHGVPGAMVSVVCNAALHRAIREFNLTQPGKILDSAREVVIHEFEKSEEDVKDGMDIALCHLNKSTLKLNYAGAHNPLWILRNGEITEYKGDKQPIGKFEHATPFTNHEIQLENDDLIYIFSDGYVDQFGGEKGKKFKPKALRELFISIADKPVNEQKTALENRFMEWKGDLEQVDDICIIGVRV